MMNLKARTELHDAWANIALVETLVAQKNFGDAIAALRDAEKHCSAARRAVERFDATVAGLENLSDRIADLRESLGVRSVATRAG